MRRLILWSCVLCFFVTHAAAQGAPAPLPNLKFDFDMWDLVVLGFSAGLAVALTMKTWTYFFGDVGSSTTIKYRPQLHHYRFLVTTKMTRPDEVTKFLERVVKLPYELQKDMSIILVGGIVGTVKHIEHRIDPDKDDVHREVTVLLEDRASYDAIKDHSDWASYGA